MNVMPTVAYLNEIVLGGKGFVLVLAGIAHGFLTNLVVLEGNLYAQRYLNGILTRHVITPFQNKANITLFQHGNAIRHTATDTVNFLRANKIAEEPRSESH